MAPNRFKEVLVTGGAGYVGAVLVPKLLAKGYKVRVLDLYIYGDDVLGPARGNPGLKQIKADMRDEAVLRDAIKGCDAVIHLARLQNILESSPASWTPDLAEEFQETKSGLEEAEDGWLRIHEDLETLDKKIGSSRTGTGEN